MVWACGSTRMNRAIGGLAGSTPGGKLAMTIACFISVIWLTWRGCPLSVAPCPERAAQVVDEPLGGDSGLGDESGRAGLLVHAQLPAPVAQQGAGFAGGLFRGGE